MKRLIVWTLGCFVGVPLCWGALAQGVPEFKLLASRRFVLDNERVIAELDPASTMVKEIQHPFLPFGAGKRPTVAFRGKILPTDMVGKRKYRRRLIL